MKLLSKYIFSALFLAASGGSATAQSMRANTYCNPLNVDYTYMIYNSSNNLSYRSGADPAVVEFRGEYYMFVTGILSLPVKTGILRVPTLPPLIIIRIPCFM